jgi:hypothetical protein
MNCNNWDLRFKAILENVWAAPLPLWVTTPIWAFKEIWSYTVIFNLSEHQANSREDLISDSYMKITL